MNVIEKPKQVIVEDNIYDIIFRCVLISALWILLNDLFLKELMDKTVHTNIFILFKVLLLTGFFFEFSQFVAKKKIIIAEASSKGTLRKYQELVDTIDGIVWEADENINFTFVSKQAERLFGYPLKEWLTPHFWSGHIYPEDRDKAVAFCKAQCELLQPHDFEYRFVAKDGTVKWLRDIVSIVTDKENKFYGLRGVMVDITDMKKVQEDFTRSLSLLGATLEATADGIVAMSLDGEIRRYNKKFLELWDLPEEVINNRNVFGVVEYISKQLVYPEKFAEMVGECFSNSRDTFRDIIEFKDGKFFERCSMPQVMSDEIVGRVSSFRDVTENKQFEKAREMLLNQEKQARIEAEKSVLLRDDFLSIASHELKTPLTPIRMQLQLVKRNINALTNDQKREHLIKLLDDADLQFRRFLKLVEGVLDVSRITAERLTLDCEELDLSQLLKDTVQALEPEFKKVDCELKVHIAPNIRGFWDRLRMEQVFSNLLTNAKKYGAGKLIEISMTIEEFNEETPVAQIIVKDHGIGMAPEDLEKHFGRFERFAPLGN